MQTRQKHLLLYCKRYHTGVSPRQNIQLEVFDKIISLNLLPEVDFHMVQFIVANNTVEGCRAGIAMTVTVLNKASADQMILEKLKPSIPRTSLATVTTTISKLVTVKNIYSNLFGRTISLKCFPLFDSRTVRLRSVWYIIWHSSVQNTLTGSYARITLCFAVQFLLLQSFVRVGAFSLYALFVELRIATVSFLSWSRV